MYVVMLIYCLIKSINSIRCDNKLNERTSIRRNDAMLS